MASKIFPDELFFALHKPDCADLRELEKAIRAIRDASRARRNSVDDIRSDAFPRIEAGDDPLASRARRCVEAQIRTATHDDACSAWTKKKPSTFRGRLRRSRIAHPRTRARRTQ